MEALLIVHTERDHLHPKLVDPANAERNKRLFEGIAALLPQHLNRGQGNRVYYLAEAAGSADSKLIYAPLRGYFSRIFQPTLQFIPYGETFEEQCIRIKERLNEDDPDVSYIVGITYRANILPLQRFLCGDTQRLRRSEFESAWEHLGKPSEQFERFYRQRLVAEIKEELTDKGR